MHDINVITYNIGDPNMHVAQLSKFFLYISCITFNQGSPNYQICPRSEQSLPLSYFNGYFLVIPRKYWQYSLPKRISLNTFSIYVLQFLAGTLSERHRSFLRSLLLKSGDVESNPGPLTAVELTKEQLVNLLHIINEEVPGYEAPEGTKDDLLVVLTQYDPKLVKVATKLLSYQNRTGSQMGTEPTIQAQNEFEGHMNTSSNPFIDTANSISPHQPFSPQIATKGIKLPNFDSSEPRLWFDQIEEILAGQSEAMKKSSLMRSITTTTLKQAGVLPQNDFQTIKKNIISFFDDSDQRRLQKLLTFGTSGDQKPSGVLRTLQQLAPGNEDLVRIRFLEVMPENLRLVLSSLSEVSLDKLAATADRMFEQLNTPTSSYGTTAVCSVNSLDEKFTTMQKQMDNLSEKINAISMSRRAHSPVNESFRGRSRSRYRRTGTLCYYHQKFGQRAIKCDPGCSWKNYNDTTGNVGAPPGKRHTVESLP